MNIDFLRQVIQEGDSKTLITKGLQLFFDIDTTDYAQLIHEYEKEDFNELQHDISYFEESINDIRDNWEHYERFYFQLKDSISKNTYLGMLYAKVFMNPQYIEEVFSLDNPYFSSEIWGELISEVYIDCGGYVGDTALKFINHCPDYKKIYIFEPMLQLAEKCRNRLQRIAEDNSIEVFPFAVSNSEKQVNFSAKTAMGDSKVTDTGELHIPAIKLDSFIKNEVTFIKMDIEGSEKDAILGAQNIIRTYAPKMAICIYHLKDDFWKIPELILNINEDYEFMVRQHDCEVYEETVLYCIPRQKKQRFSNLDIHKIVNRMSFVRKELKFLDADEFNNHINHIKDKKWFLKQIRGYKRYNDLLKLENDNSQKSIDWLQSQYENYKKLDAQQKEVIKELKNWINDLEAGKAWLEDHSKEQEEYINKLLESKDPNKGGAT